MKINANTGFEEGQKKSFLENPEPRNRQSSSNTNTRFLLPITVMKTKTTWKNSRRLVM